jgi:hypothetical protein
VEVRRRVIFEVHLDHDSEEAAYPWHPGNPPRTASMLVIAQSVTNTRRQAGPPARVGVPASERIEHRPNRTTLLSQTTALGGHPRWTDCFGERGERFTGEA